MSSLWNIYHSTYFLTHPVDLLLTYLCDCSRASAGFWLGVNAPLPPEAKKILKIWQRNGAYWSISVLYTCLPWLLSKYNTNIENCCFFACFRFLIFHPFSRGSADPICPYVRTPMWLFQTFEFSELDQSKLNKNRTCMIGITVLFPPRSSNVTWSNRSPPLRVTIHK